jgi:hypothetical protein
VCNHHSSLPDIGKQQATRNHHEVLRCYDVLVAHHKDKLVAGLIVRMSSVEDGIRRASLTILKHVITSSFERVEDKMEEIFRAVHSRLKIENSASVQIVLVQVVALLGRKGYLRENEVGRDFMDFVVKFCAEPDKAEWAKGGESLRETCGNILQLFATNVPALEPLLWPRLIDCLLQPGRILAVAPVIKSLNSVMKRREAESMDVRVAFGPFAYADGPLLGFRPPDCTSCCACSRLQRLFHSRLPFALLFQRQPKCAEPVGPAYSLTATLSRKPSRRRSRMGSGPMGAMAVDLVG